MSNYYQSNWADSYYRLWPFPKFTAYATPLSTNFDKICQPSLYYPLDYPAVYYTPLWPLIIIVIIVYLIWTEYGSQDCREQNCNNRAQVIKSNDNTNEAIDKISYNVRKNHTIIGWRRALIVAIILSLIILFLICPSFPDGFTILVTIIIIFVLVYFSFAWFQAHWWKFNNDKIDQSLQQLRHRLSKN